MDVGEESGLGEFAVGDDVDAALHLLAHDVARPIRQQRLEFVLIVRLAGELRLHQVEQIVRARQAADMGCLDAVGVLLDVHGLHIFSAKRAPCGRLPPSPRAVEQTAGTIAPVRGAEQRESVKDHSLIAGHHRAVELLLDLGDDREHRNVGAAQQISVGFRPRRLERAVAPELRRRGAIFVAAVERKATSVSHLVAGFGAGTRPPPRSRARYRA